METRAVRSRGYARWAPWLTALGLGVIAVLFAVLVDWPVVIQDVRGADLRYLLAGWAALAAGAAVHATRWRLLLSQKPGWTATFHAANIGQAVNVLVPLRVGEAVRILALARAQSLAMAEVTASVVVERLLEQIMRLAALGGAIVFGMGVRASAGAILGGAAFLAAACVALAWVLQHRALVIARGPGLLARLPRLGEAQARRLLADVLAGLESLGSARRLAQALFWSSLAWTCFWAFHALVLVALPIQLASSQVLSLSLGALALAPPSAATAPGVYHASIAAPLAVAGFDENLLAAYTLVIHALLLALFLMLGGWGLTRLGLSTRELIPAGKN